MSRSLYFRLSLMLFLQFFIWGTWYVTLSTYLLAKLHFTGPQIGLIYGATALSASITPFFLGILADRIFSTEKILSVLHLSGGCVMWFTSYFTEFQWFYPCMVLYTLFYMPTFTLSSSLSLQHIQDVTKDFPKVRVWGSISWIFTGVIISYLHLESEVLPMRISASFSIIQGFYCLTLPHTPPQPQLSKFTLTDVFGKEILQLLKKKEVLILILALAFIQIPASFYYSFVNPFLNEIGVSNSAGKLTLGQVTEVLIMLALPWFLQKFLLRFIITAGLMCWGLRYLLFAWGGELHQEWMLYIGILVHGVVYNFSTLSSQIFIDRQVPKHLRSTAQGFITFVTMGIGFFIGSFIAGLVVQGFTLPDGTHAWWHIWQLPGWFGIAVAVTFLVFIQRAMRDKA
ncbi:MAG: MFS transporter [Saprospiraceae bacterium]